MKKLDLTQPFTVSTLLDTDTYKMTHHLQYPAELTKMYSYLESRADSAHRGTLFFGLQPILGRLARQVTTEDIAELANRCKAYCGHDFVNKQELFDVINDHKGFLPIKIKAVPEGTFVPGQNVLMTLESTDPRFAKYTNAIETQLLRVWYPITVATYGYYRRYALMQMLAQTGTPENVDYMVHDFGSRGVSSQEQAAIGGAAHLINFRESDNNIGDAYLRHFYGYKEASILKSVWATEHSVAMTYGPGDGEIAYVNAQLDNAPDDAIISVVGDTYDIYYFCEHILTEPKIMAKIKKREGRFVVRPDSGNPPEVINRCLNILGNKFGITYIKGFKLIGNNIGLLQGDGMEEGRDVWVSHIQAGDGGSIPKHPIGSTMIDLYKSIIDNGWSADNLVVGSGGGLLMKRHRDEEQFALKASYVEFIA